MKTKIHFYIFLVFAIGLISCSNTESEFQTQLVSSENEVQTGVNDEKDSLSSIRIASFNIQNFGKSKMRTKPLVVDTLVDIFLKYDLIAVQEISHKNGDTPNRFLDSLNMYSENAFDMLISERSGMQENDISSQEQYGFYFRTAQIQALDQGVIYPDHEHDFFQREPYMAHFKTVDGNFDFVVITTHTAPAKSGAPDLTIDEVSALDKVVAWARTHYPDEEDFIIVGDFNADCNYVDEEELEELDIKKNYQWVIPNSEKTNLAKSNDCTYDRIVISRACSEDFNGSWGVDRSFVSKKVSDHWPVWAEFYIHLDSD